MVNRYEKARKVRPRNRSVPGARVPNPAETLTPAGPPNSGSYCDSTAAGRTSAWGPTLSSGPIPSKGDDVAHHRAGSPDRRPRHPRPDRPEQAPQRGARTARRVNARGARRRSHRGHRRAGAVRRDRKSTRLNSSHLVISYAVFCLKKKKKLAFSEPLECPRGRQHLYFEPKEDHDA